MTDAVALTAGAIVDERLGHEAPFEITGLVQATAGTIVIHDGTSAAGAPVLASSAIGTVSLNFAAACRVGVFVVLTGGATGSLLTN